MQTQYPFTNTVVAARNLSQGEEIFSSYLAPITCEFIRQRTLWQGWSVYYSKHLYLLTEMCLAFWVWLLAMLVSFWTWEPYQHSSLYQMHFWKSHAIQSTRLSFSMEVRLWTWEVKSFCHNIGGDIHDWNWRFISNGKVCITMFQFLLKWNYRMLI